MKIFIRIIKVLAVLIITVTLILFSAALIMQDRVADIILKSLNKSISTKFEFESVSLSFLRKFPGATINLKNVLVHSSPGFDKDVFGPIDTDTLLFAKSVSAEFDISDIYHGIYNIERIGIKDGILKLFSDSSGRVNYDIAVEAESEDEGGKEFTLDLKRVSVSNLNAYYNNRAIELVVEGIFENGHIKSRISGENIDFGAESGIQISNFQLYNTRIDTSLFADIKISLSVSDTLTVFKKGALEFDDFKFSVTGSVSEDDFIDLLISGENLDIDGLKKYLPGKILSAISGYNPSGRMQVSSKIRGKMTRTSYPGITVDFSLKNGSVTLPDNPLNINGVSFNGNFTNGQGHNPSTSAFSVKDFSGKLGSALYTGSFSINNFDSLNCLIHLKGKVIPSEMKEFFNLKAIFSSGGYLDADLQMKGRYPSGKTFAFWDILQLDPQAVVVFNNFSLGLKNDNIRIEEATGKLIISDSVTAEKLNFIYKNHRVEISGVFRNLPEWLAGKPVMLIASGSLKSDRFISDVLFPPSAENNKPKQIKKAGLLPEDIILDIGFTADTFRIKDFSAGKINGTVSYKPGLLNVKTLNMNSLDGRISASGFIVQKPDKSFSARGSFDLKGININSAFISFSNFGQTFLKAENINGNLTGSLSVLLQADSLFKIDVKTISAEGKYLITQGALTDFEPVKQLSKFIELSELENIRFEELENDFFIRNNFLYIPQMDVRSSAADLSVNGKHSFENQYEYHVKALLSEILSRKFRKPRPNTTEFGAVQDDGLGRTSILLKIESRGDDVKVGYDLKAAGNEIRNDIKAERRTLKTILNEEYGWFKKDTVIPEKPASGTPRFRIAWEESDTTGAVVEEKPEEKPDNPLKNLLKKKKN